MTIVTFLNLIFYKFESVRNMTSILFSILILFQSLNLNAENFAKFQVLLEHAQFHQETYGDSFLEFIVDHYGGEEHHDHMEHEEHEDLPFKHSHQSCSQMHSVFVLSLFQFTVQQQEYAEVPLNFFYKESHSLYEKEPVFQPPKAA